MSALQAQAIPDRKLRDGREVVRVPGCPHCGAEHYVIADGTLATPPCGAGRVLLLDGLGSVRR